MTRITSVFSIKASIFEYLGRVPVLKGDAHFDILTVEPCELTNTLCLGRSLFERPFFFMYSCLFSNSHVSLPFDNFTMGVLQELNVAPSQLHLNTWVSIQAFRVICDVFRFLSYYTSHLGEPVIWHSLINQSGNVLFNSFTTSYKNFKGKFFKVFIQPEGTKLFFDEVGRSRFLMFSTRNPSKFKE